VAVYRRSSRPRYVLALLVLTSITLITLDERGQGSGVVASIRSGARDAFAPVASVADKLFTPVGNFFSGAAHYGDLKAENARLRRELEAARAASSSEADLAREYQSLLALDNLDFANDVPTIAARVIATSPSNFQATITLDRGSGSGIERGMPVVTGAGLVGRVIDVSRHRSVVLLVTDQSSNVGVRLSVSGDVGVARGDGPGRPLPVDLIDIGTTIGHDELLVTSGFQDSLFPPGIPVGRVRSATSPPGALQQQVTIDPVVDVHRLDFVKVLRWKPVSP
jgi:rod shape-determining protein MreC